MVATTRSVVAKAPKGASLSFRKQPFGILFLLFPCLAFGHSGHLDDAQKALQAARLRVAAQHAEVTASRQQAAADAARAAQLAQQQVAAAAALRALEDQTAQAAATLDDLAARAKAAGQALQQNEAALAALLPVMERLAQAPAATMLAVPAAPEDAIRSVLVLQGIAAEIERRAKAVHAEAAQVAALQAATRTQQAALTQAVGKQQTAEAALSLQIAAAQSAETSDLGTAIRAAAAEAAATQNVHDLQGMVEKLQAKARHDAANRSAARSLTPGPSAGSGPIMAGAPVAGTLVQDYGAPTVAGPAVGMVYRAAPGARVVAPCAGPVLYADPFQRYGLLVILDCGKNYDFVLSGMQHLDVTAGQHLARGQPVGEMASYDASTPTRQPLLYVELRQSGKPVNPAVWLNGGGSG